MRIGLVLYNTPTYSETFFRAKISGLNSFGWEVILFTDKKSPDFDLCPVKKSPKIPKFFILQIVFIICKYLQLTIIAPKQCFRFFQLERNSGRGVKQALENIYLNSHILTEKLDWLHFGFATTALRREHVAKAIGARMGVSLRGYDIALYPLRHPGCYKSLWENVDKVHSISKDLLELAYQDGLPKDSVVETIMPAVDVSRFKRLNKFTLPIESPVKILTVARLHWKKGLEYTLEALAILKKLGVQFQYTIIGSGEEYERLAFTAYQLNIQDLVHFTGKIPHEQVKSEMEKMDIYLQYSIQEGFCNAVLEAQAMGLLCIVSDAEGLSENVSNGVTGWVIPKRQPKLLAKKIQEVIELSDVKLNEIHQNSINRVCKIFSIENQKLKFRSFFQEI